MSRYLKRQGIEPCFVWVREVGRIKHEHTHLLVHLPEWHRGKNYVQLRAELVSRLTGIGGFRANGIRIGRNPGYPGTPAMRWGWGCYFLKSLDPALTIGLGAGTVSLAEVLGIRLEQDLMPLSGRRSHSTENLGPKARLEAGYREVDDPLGLAHLLSQGSCLTRRGRRARKRSRVPPPPH
ncbi:hypothetical protein E2C05_20420 [Paracraurococcus ruber]|nr:hypothetical protein [Paracraurococcus ruber]TDG28542.1 hypothetical protein E2C05_20420 [Paracraurococcus ruber]